MSLLAAGVAYPDLVHASLRDRPMLVQQHAGGAG